MPNRYLHAQIGGSLGAATAILRAKDQPNDLIVAEVIGSTLSGVLGGLLPDFIEPATSPNHRKAAHSVTAGASLVFVQATGWQGECRRRAITEIEQASYLAPRSREHSRSNLMALLWALLAGLIGGLIAGYASHLALDAMTPRSLPLIG